MCLKVQQMNDSKQRNLASIAGHIGKCGVNQGGQEGIWAGIIIIIIVVPLGPILKHTVRHNSSQPACLNTKPLFSKGVVLYVTVGGDRPFT